MKQKLFCTISGVFLLIGSVTAQSSVADSIRRAVSQQKKDTALVEQLIRKAFEYEQADARRAIAYYQTASAISQSLNYLEGVEKSNTGLMEAFMTLAQLDSMMHYAQENLRISRQMNDSVKIGRALINIGISYRTSMDYDDALTYFLQGREYLGDKGNELVKIGVLDALQALYYDRSEYEKGIRYGKEALPLARKLNDPFNLCKVLVNLAVNHTGLRLYDQATPLLEEALRINQQLKNPMIEAVCLQNLADIALQQGKTAVTKPYLYKVLPLYRKMEVGDSEAACLRGLAVCALQEKNPALARRYADSAMTIAKSLKLLKEEASIQKVISSIAYFEGNVEEGLERYQMSEATLQIMIKDILSEQTTRLEKKLETANKQKEIERLKAEKTLQDLTIQQKTLTNYLLAGGAILLLLIIYFISKINRQKQKLQQQRISELETEKQLTATQAVLKGEEQERTRLARDLHDGLGGMLSGIKHSLNTMKENLIMTPDNAAAFERSIDMLNSSIQEMRRVAHNMMPESLVKFGLDTALNDFCQQVNQAGTIPVTYQSVGLDQTEIDQTRALNIYRIVQELVNNALKHSAAKSILVQLILTKTALSITVEDDGKGFDPVVLQAVKGIGWSNLRNRVEFLKGNMDLRSKPGEGTSVQIDLDL